jgi:hypothetical protein
MKFTECKLQFLQEISGILTRFYVIHATVFQNVHN